MGRASRDKGSRWELAILQHFRARGYAAMRSRQFKQGGGEEPDVLAVLGSGSIPLNVECKDRKTLPSKAHVDALQQAEAAGPGLAIAVHKIARRPIGEAIVNLRLGAFLELMEVAYGPGKAAKPEDLGGSGRGGSALGEGGDRSDGGGGATDGEG